MIKPDVVVELPPYQVPAKGIKEWEHLDHATRLALAQQSLAERGQSLHLISRYESRLRRQYDKALQNLYLVQSKRRPPQASPRPITSTCPQRHFAFETLPRAFSLG